MDKAYCFDCNEVIVTDEDGNVSFSTWIKHTSHDVVINNKDC